MKTLITTLLAALITSGFGQIQQQLPVPRSEAEGATFAESLGLYIEKGTDRTYVNFYQHDAAETEWIIWVGISSAYFGISDTIVVNEDNEEERDRTISTPISGTGWKTIPIPHGDFTDPDDTQTTFVLPELNNGLRTTDWPNLDDWFERKDEHRKKKWEPGEVQDAHMDIWFIPDENGDPQLSAPPRFSEPLEKDEMQVALERKKAAAPEDPVPGEHGYRPLWGVRCITYNVEDVTSDSPNPWTKPELVAGPQSPTENGEIRKSFMLYGKVTAMNSSEAEIGHVVPQSLETALSVSVVRHDRNNPPLDPPGLVYKREGPTISELRHYPEDTPCELRGTFTAGVLTSMSTHEWLPTNRVVSTFECVDMNNPDHAYYSE